MRLRRTGAAWLVACGDASYSLYLSHTMVLGTVALAARHLHLQRSLAQFVFVLVAYGTCLCVALALYRTVERPLLHALHPARVMPVGTSAPSAAS